MRTESNEDRGRSRVVQIWLDIYNVPELEDLPSRMATPVERREVQEDFGLTNTQMSDLCLACGANEGYDIYSLPKERAEDMLVYIQEGMHSGFDGYTDEDRFVIQMFLNDVGLGLKYEDDWKRQQER